MNLVAHSGEVTPHLLWSVMGILTRLKVYRARKNGYLFLSDWL